MGSIRTVVDTSTDETSECEGTVEDTVCGIRQRYILKTTSSQVGYG